MKQPKVYPLAAPYQSSRVQGAQVPRDCMAVATGEKRNPRKGEWYLSGAIVEAYLSPGNLDYPLHIAKLVRVKRTEHIEVLGDWTP